MTPAEASDIIGCSPAQVRYLVRTKQLRAKRRRILGGFVYDVSVFDVKRYADKPQTVGFPRGQSRK